MQRLIDSYKTSGDLHHAYFLVGDADEIVLKLKDFLEEEVGVKTSGSADFWHGRFNTLNIEGARNIAEAQERKEFSNGRKIFVIQADFITEEAQNSLLKVFEEPTSGTHFFIISPQEILLPTLRSRMQVLIIPRAALGRGVTTSSRVLDMKLGDRLAKVKEITEAISDEEQTKQDAISFLNQIELELHALGVEKSAKSLEICEATRASLYDRGAPVKMILENLVMNI